MSQLFLKLKIKKNFFFLQQKNFRKFFFKIKNEKKLFFLHYKFNASCNVYMHHTYMYMMHLYIYICIYIHMMLYIKFALKASTKMNEIF